MLGWGLLIGAPLLAAVLFTAAARTRYFDLEPVFVVFGGLSALAGLMAWLFLPLVHLDLVGQIAAHKETGATMQRARANAFEGFERATLQREVVETNRGLRYYQVMDSYWGPFIPDAVHDVDPVE